jgi:transcription antitermination factor NusG
VSEEKWYVLHTNPRAEKKVAIGLSKIGIQHYLPLQKHLKKYKDSKKYVDIPLIKSHIFVKTIETRRNIVFEIGGIVKYLHIGGKIAVVTEREINQLKLFCTQDEVSIMPSKLQKGDEVEIISGIFIGMRGILYESENGTKININIPSIECVAIINIDRKNVVKLRQRN